MATRIPNVVHPNPVRVNGVLFEVISFFPLTHDQAAQIAQLHYRALAAPHRYKGQTLQAIWPHSRQKTAALAGMPPAAG